MADYVINSSHFLAIYESGFEDSNTNQPFSPVDLDDFAVVTEMERIVRCRDCSYYGEGDYMDSGMVCWIDKNHAMPAQPDGFCAWGEVSGNG